MNATNMVEINEAREKIEKKRERKESEEMVRGTRHAREKKKGVKEGSTDSMTRLKLYSSDEQDRIQRVPSYRERRVASFSGKIRAR